MMKPAVRPYAGQVVTDVAIGLLAELHRAWHWVDDLDQMTYQLNGELMFVRQQLVNLRREQEQTTVRIEALQRELAQARTNLARRPAATSLVLPAQKITVESTIQRKVLAPDGGRGPGPRLAHRRAVLADGLTGYANTVRNAIVQLVERELLADYDQHGKPGWTYKAGGTRRLVQLTPTGRQWCQAAFGQAPVESEIAIAARRHKSVSHGIAVLETAYHLAAAGYAVETEPGAVLAAADEPWRARPSRTWPSP